MSDAPAFGPPRFWLFAFGWSALQPLRAVWWQLRFGELRSLAVRPAVVTAVVGLALVVAAIIGAAPLQQLVMEHGSGALAQATWIGARVLITLALLLAAAVSTVQLSTGISAASLERMSLFVQQRVTGSAPAATLGVGQVLWRALRSVVPSIKSLVLWALLAAAAAGLVLVPGVGPVLVVVAQVLLTAGFLAHGAVTESRERLGLPRWLFVREPACLLGLTVGFAPIVLVPPLLLLGSGVVAVSGALVALGVQQRRGAS